MARGSIVRRSPRSWGLRVELEPDLETGRRRQRRETITGTKKQAQERLAKLLTEVHAGQVGNAGAMTVGDLLDRFLEEHARPNLSPKTAHRYGQLVNLQLKPLIGRVPLEKLTPAHVLRVKAGLRGMVRRRKPRNLHEDETPPPPRPLAGQTQRHAFRLLHTALGHAVVWRLLPSNPADGIPAPRATTGEMHPFTAAQATAFVAALEDATPHWRAFFLVALSTGMRLGELCGLRWEDVDAQRRSLRVAQTIAYIPGGTEPGGYVVKPPKTAAGQRTVPIDPELVEALRAHKADQNTQRLGMGALWTDHDLVFPGLFGCPLHDRTVRREFARLCAVAEVPSIRVHDLRHTCATLLLLAGINVKVVSERLGHASVAITMQTYAHVLPGMQEEAAVAIGRLLRGAG